MARFVKNNEGFTQEDFDYFDIPLFEDETDAQILERLRAIRTWVQSKDNTEFIFEDGSFASLKEIRQQNSWFGRLKSAVGIG